MSSYTTLLQSIYFEASYNILDSYDVKSYHTVLRSSYITPNQNPLTSSHTLPYLVLSSLLSDLNKNTKGQIKHRRGSIKMMQGWCSLAYPNISRMIRADSPMYLSTIADATTSALSTRCLKNLTIQLIKKTNVTTSMTRKLSHLSLVCNQTWTCLPLFFWKKNLDFFSLSYSTHQSSISHISFGLPWWRKPSCCAPWPLLTASSRCPEGHREGRPWAIWCPLAWTAPEQMIGIHAVDVGYDDPPLPQKTPQKKTKSHCDFQWLLK